MEKELSNINKPSLEDISNVINDSLKKVFGVIGLGNKRSLKDSISVLFKQESIKDGVSVKIEKNSYIIDVYVILFYGVKISEVVYNISSQIKYDLNNNFKIKIKTINVYVQDIQKI